MVIYFMQKVFMASTQKIIEQKYLIKVFWKEIFKFKNILHCTKFNNFHEIFSRELNLDF